MDDEGFEGGLDNFASQYIGGGLKKQPDEEDVSSHIIIPNEIHYIAGSEGGACHPCLPGQDVNSPTRFVKQDDGTLATQGNLNTVTINGSSSQTNSSSGDYDSGIWGSHHGYSGYNPYTFRSKDIDRFWTAVSIGLLTDGAGEFAGPAFASSSTVGRVFWSGGGNPAIRAAAEQFASENGMTTLEMTRAGRNLTDLTEGMQWDAARPYWQRLSSAFANGAQGEAHVFQGVGGVSIESVWRTEYSILNSNNVNIIYHLIP